MYQGLSLTLRPFEDADLSVLAPMRLDVALQHQLLAWPPENGDPDVTGWIERRMQDAQGVFYVIADATNHALGFAQMTGLHAKGRHAMIGLALAAQARGKGYGNAALYGLLEQAREGLGLRKVMLEVRADNKAAIQLYRKAAFREVGVLQRHYHDGIYFHDVILMEKGLDEPILDEKGHS
jgi:RimJ/RimL family protein N-acetyltransferase